MISILAIWQFVGQGSVGGLWYLLGERSFTSLTPGIANASLNGALVLRPYATFPHPNVLAGFLVLMSIYLLYFSPRKIEIGFWKNISNLALLLGAIALVLSMSRTGIAVLAAVWVVWIVKRGNSRRLPRVLLMIFSFLILILIVQTGIYLRFSGFNFFEESLTVREFLLSKSWEIFSKQALIGVGLQNFLPSLIRLLPQGVSLTYIQPVHSFYFLLLSETGIVGGFLVFVFALHLISKAVLPPNRLGKMVLLFALAFLFTTDHYFYTLHQGQLLLGFCMGLALSESNFSQTKEGKFLEKTVLAIRRWPRLVKILRTGTRIERGR